MTLRRFRGGRWAARALGTAAAFVAITGHAHHSMAMFDLRASTTLHGSVREFQWTNPHCYVQLLVQERGATVEWSVEMAAPADLYRQGFRPGTLQPGNPVVLVIHPIRDGTHAGAFVSGTHVDGRPLVARPAP